MAKTSKQFKQGASASLNKSIQELKDYLGRLRLSPVEPRSTTPKAVFLFGLVHACDDFDVVFDEASPDFLLLLARMRRLSQQILAARQRWPICTDCERGVDLSPLQGCG
ncbi:hypothetical protein ABIB90_006250 [Bradyrhizobium sp. JR4.1]|uniref:hypothetical protein n=1 Tax=unclassified Bradyrhizobium TaxID=2631580 RepID=UPI0012EC9FC8|nr:MULTISPECIES: hypothetical protein [unclassified Bradyrhizobium]MDH2357675.1 hypothetical protein [Bradyrhizobium sp. SSUT112]